MKTKDIKQLALCAMFCALSTVLCIVASLFPTLSLSVVAISGIAAAAALLECGYKKAFLVYVASSVLVALLAPDKECAAYFIVFFGHYPMLKLVTERIKNKPLMWVCKIAEANALFAVLFLIITFVLGISEEVGVYEKIITLILFNIAFVLYDICLTRLMALYIRKSLKKGRFH